MNSPFGTFNLADIALRTEQVAASRANREQAQAKVERERKLSELLPQAMRGDQAAMDGVAGVDPDMFFKIKTHMGTLDKANREREAGRWKAAGPLLARLKSVPAEQRGAFLQSAAPMLIANGWTQEELAGFDPSDQSIDALSSAAMTVEQVLKATTPQEFDVQPGAGRYERDPQTGEIRTIVAPWQEGATFGQPVGGGGNIPTISSPEEAKRLPPGTQFRTPDGRIKRVPGGPASAPGGFPGGN